MATDARRWCAWRCPRPCCCWAACTTLGPDFKRPQVPWLAGLVRRRAAVATLAEEAPRRAQPRDDEWWRNFDDPVLDQLVDEAQRLNPGVRTAGLRILEARAQLGIAGSGLYPQLQQLNARGAARRQAAAATAADRHFWTGGVGLRRWPGSWTSGASSGAASSRPMPATSPASRSTTTCRCWSRRRPRACTRRFAPSSCGCASRNENAALQKRSLEITERLFRSGNESELDVQQARSQYLSTLATIPELESSLRQTQNALCVLLARPPGAAARDGGRTASRFPRRELEVDRRHARRAAAPPARRARRRDAAGRAVGADRRQRGGAVSVDRARGLGRPVGHVSIGSPSTTLDWGTRPGAGVEHLRLRPAEEPGAGAGRALPAALRAVPGHGAARRRELDDAAIGFAYTRAQVGILRESVQAARRSLDIADGPVPRRPGRLRARARFAARAVQPAGAPGGHAGRRRAEPDRGLQGDGRRLAGGPRAAGRSTTRRSHDGRAQRLEAAAATPRCRRLSRGCRQPRPAEPDTP